MHVRTSRRGVGIAALMALAAATAVTTSGAVSGAGDDSPLTAFGEDPSAADPALVAKALGDVEPSAPESWDIVLAAIARAIRPRPGDDRQGDGCWSSQRCDTGSGGGP